MHNCILAIQVDKKMKKNTLKGNAIYVKGMEKEKMADMTHRTKLDLTCRELEEGTGAAGIEQDGTGQCQEKYRQREEGLEPECPVRVQQGPGCHDHHGKQTQQDT